MEQDTDLSDAEKGGVTVTPDTLDDLAFLDLDLALLDDLFADFDAWLKSDDLFADFDAWLKSDDPFDTHRTTVI